MSTLTFLRRAARAVSVTTLAVASALSVGLAGGSVAHADAPTFYMFDNGKLRFGGNDDCYDGCTDVNLLEGSLSDLGLLKQPFYWSGNDSTWYKLTYSTYPLNLAIGTGTNGSNWSGADVTDITSLDNLAVDTSGFTSTGALDTGVKGYGVLQATGTTQLSGQDVEITNRSELTETGSYVKITTTVKNTSADPLLNTTMWVGTQDDFVGNNDDPTKTKGNIVDGAFTPITDQAETASALLIESGPEGVLFYSTTEGANASIDSCCSFSNAYEVNPVESPMQIEWDDGSYAMNLPVADLQPGETTSITWFYAAGATETLDQVITEVSAAARPAAPTVTPGNHQATVQWTAPASNDPITDYIVRYSVHGENTWTQVRKGNATAPLTKVLSPLTNGTTYDVQVAAVTGTDPNEVVGTYSSARTVTPGNPVNNVRPTVSGTALVGNTLTVTDPNNRWTSVDGSPMTASYQWTSDGVAIPGATSTSYRVTAAVAGTEVAIVATRTNTSGPTHVKVVADTVPDLYLADLLTSDGSLSPSFLPGRFSYTVSVGNGVSALGLTPSAPDGATITVNGVAAASGDLASVDLDVGSNTITIVVTVGSDSLTYTLTVTRASGETPQPPSYEPVTPTRVVDTRDGKGGHRIGAGKVMVVHVAGRNGVPADATSALLNIAVTGAEGLGFVTVYPCDQERPTTSNLNIESASAVSNSVLAQLAADGTVCVYSSIDADVIVDVSGYFDADGAQYQPLNPSRLVDTRIVGEPVAADHVLQVIVAGHGGVPADATSAVLNVAIVDPAAAGYATVYPCGTDRPETSNVNFDAGRTVSNSVVAQIGDQGKVCIYLKASAHVIVDVDGAFTPSGLSLQHGVNPARLVDTRVSHTRVEGGSVLEVPVAGHGGVPANATSVTLNVTIVDSDGPSYATVFPCGSKRPIASNVNVDRRNAVPNAVFAKLGDGGKVCIFVLASADVVVDVTGYAAPANG